MCGSVFSCQLHDSHEPVRFTGRPTHGRAIRHVTEQEIIYLMITKNRECGFRNSFSREFLVRPVPFLNSNYELLQFKVYTVIITQPNFLAKVILIIVIVL